MRMKGEAQSRRSLVRLNLFVADYCRIVARTDSRVCSTLLGNLGLGCRI
jgi:hypothetical protein